MGTSDGCEVAGRRVPRGGGGLTDCCTMIRQAKTDLILTGRKKNMAVRQNAESGIRNQDGSGMMIVDRCVNGQARLPMMIDDS